MSETITATATYPQQVLEQIKAGQIRVHIYNNTVLLVPTWIPESPMRGFLSDGKLSTEDFMRRKQEEKELEL